MDYVIEKFPFRIHTVRTDRGHEFQALFHWHVEDKGIRHVYIKPRSPQLNGKVDRSHRSDGEEFYQLLTYTDDVDLNKKLEEIIRQEKDLDRAPVFLHFNPCELEDLIPDLSHYEEAGEFRLDAKAAIELALALNRGTVDFFSSYADKFAETQGKQIFLSFAGRERNHYDQMQRRMEAIQSLSEPA